jgi:hypothetical protein
MDTEVLIEALAGRLEPVSPGAPVRRMALFVLGGAAVSAVLMLEVLGLRADFGRAMATPMFWTKFAYSLALGGLGLWAAERLGRPGAAWDRPGLIGLGVVVVFGVLAMIRFASAAPDARRHLVMGHSAMLCPWYIFAFSLPVLAGLMIGLRRLAPTRPVLAGFAAGLASGGLAAFVYAFSCNESGMPFVAVWYTLPVLAAGLAGASIGRFALRW